MARSKGPGRHRIIDLKSGDAQLPQRALHPQMRGVDRIGVESFLALELGVEHDVAGIIDAAVVQAHFKVKQAGDFSAQLLEERPN
jgi:hypothetical protein